MSKWIFEHGHTEAEFKARHMMVTRVRGLIKDVHGTMEFDWESCVGSTFEGRMDARQLWTGEPNRDAHLRSADFSTSRSSPGSSSLAASSSAPMTTHFKAEAELTIQPVRALEHDGMQRASAVGR